MNSERMTSKEDRRAALAAGIFSAFGLLGIFFALPNLKIPLLLFYAVLVLNTYFSLRSFGRIVPAKTPRQKILDAMLFILYAGLAGNLANLKNFAIIATSLFLAATLKYAPFRASGTKSQNALIKRKVFANLMGAISSFLAIIGALAGYETQTAWLWAGLFAIASAYYLFLNPLYPKNLPT